MYKYLLIIVLIVICLYLIICLFCIGINGNFYIENMPMIDNIGTYQTYNFIPLCLFTNYFDKKIYIE